MSGVQRGYCKKMTLHEGAAPFANPAGFDCEFGMNLRILLRRN